MSYNMVEYTDMIICYGMADAARIYAERFPNRERHPSSKAIRKCILRTKETGSLLPDTRNYGPPIRRNVGLEEGVFRMFEENPGTSVRRAARALGLPRCTVHHILRQNNLQPFHYQRLTLTFGDEAPKLLYITGLVNHGHRSLMDEFKESRSKSVVVLENRHAVRELIMQDCHVTYRKIETSLSISMTSIHKILHEHLAVKKICSRWIPHKLTITQKQAHINWCKEMLKKYNHGASKTVSITSTGDESWIYSYEPESFLTLLERKILGYVQECKGPNKVGLGELLQPFRDAIKLFRKEFANSLYSLMGAVRAISQTLLYKVSLIIIFLMLMILKEKYSFMDFIDRLCISGMDLYLSLFLIFLVIVISELNRRPIDFESELVSGFSVEYFRIAFALIFLAE
ncbi:NU1M oxidoreductase, partial [Acromyrmex charruanus]